jgi:hypothetical protein
MSAPDPSEFGPLFLLAASFGGDLAMTSEAAGVPLGQLEATAERLGWRERFDSLQATRDNDGPDALARELNRMTNFDQAQRARRLLDTAVEHFAAQSIGDLTSVQTEKTTNHSARVLVDLVKAVETVQALTYRALGDSATERTTEAKLLGPGRLAAASRGVSPAQTLTQALDSPDRRLEPPAKPKQKSKRKPYMRPGFKPSNTFSAPRAEAQAAKLADSLDKPGFSQGILEHEPSATSPAPPPSETFSFA